MTALNTEALNTPVQIPSREIASGERLRAHALANFAPNDIQSIHLCTYSRFYTKVIGIFTILFCVENIKSIGMFYIHTRVYGGER
jgi:hypothetical protein